MSYIDLTYDDTDPCDVLKPVPDFEEREGACSPGPPDSPDRTPLPVIRPDVQDAQELLDYGIALSQSILEDATKHDYYKTRDGAMLLLTEMHFSFVESIGLLDEFDDVNSASFKEINEYKTKIGLPVDTKVSDFYDVLDKYKAHLGILHGSDVVTTGAPIERTVRTTFRKFTFKNAGRTQILDAQTWSLRDVLGYVKQTLNIANMVREGDWVRIGEIIVTIGSYCIDLTQGHISLLGALGMPFLKEVSELITTFKLTESAIFVRTGLRTAVNQTLRNQYIYDSSQRTFKHIVAQAVYLHPPLAAVVTVLLALIKTALEYHYAYVPLRFETHVNNNSDSVREKEISGLTRLINVLQIFPKLGTKLVELRYSVREADRIWRYALDDERDVGYDVRSGDIDDALRIRKQVQNDLEELGIKTGNVEMFENLQRELQKDVNVAASWGNSQTLRNLQRMKDTVMTMVSRASTSSSHLHIPMDINVLFHLVELIKELNMSIENKSSYNKTTINMYANMLGITASGEPAHACAGGNGRGGAIRRSRRNNRTTRASMVDEVVDAYLARLRLCDASDS